MSTHIQRQLGKALAEKLSQYEWPVVLFPTIAAEYRRSPDFDREDTEQLRVSVSPGSMNWNGQTGMQPAPRRSDTVAVALNIGISRVATTTEEVEALEDLSIAIQDAIRSGHIDPAEGLDLLDLQEAPDVKEYEERDIFATNIGVMWGTWKQQVPAPAE